jgi:hypothetical protein
MPEIRDPDAIARRVSDALTRGPIRVDRSRSAPRVPLLCAASPTPGPDRVYYWVLYRDTGPAAIVVAAQGRTTTLVPTPAYRTGIVLNGHNTRLVANLLGLAGAAMVVACGVPADFTRVGSR